MTTTAQKPQTEPVRPARRPPLLGIAGLVAALIAGGVLLALPSNHPKPTDGQRAEGLTDVWPDAERVDLPGSLSDGPAFSPVFFLDSRVALGTAPSPDGTMLRLLLRAADGSTREIRRLPINATPQYGGFTRSGDTMAWAESISAEDGTGQTRMWVANLSAGTPARQLTDDTGDAVFFNSEYDMVIDGGRLHWAAVAPGETSATELRSISLAGGDVAIRTEPGAWALSARGWLVSAGSGQVGPVQLRDLAARKVYDIEIGASELVTCSPTWCRVLVLAGDGPSRIDLMRPDGSDRQRIASGTATASTIDVAQLDRFEVLAVSATDVVTVDSQQLLLYDIAKKRTVAVAESVGLVVARAGILWWSTGDNELTEWHSLNLASLS
jgi:hypothetical protein